MAQECNDKNVNNMLDFLFSAPYKEEVVSMDCNDYCEQLAHLAEEVAQGKSLEDLMPDWQEHIRYWADCREEFNALVAVIKAETGTLPEKFDEYVKGE